MRYLDLSYEGRQLAQQNQQDNGKLPHGGYRGTKKHPPSHLSYEKGREFQQKLEQEMERLFEEEELIKHGTTPSWSLSIHREPSYTDESPLITRNLLAANKEEQANGVNLFNRTSLLPNKCARPIKSNGVMYYRPNRMHQYLSATELKNCAEDEINIQHGRPTRTTLLRARQRCSSAPNNAYDNRREFLHKLDEIRSTCPVSPSSEYLQLQSVRDGESLHSYLTGARYNRAHCLDSKSVEHSGVYMPRHNPALGSFFRGPKGQEYLQEFLESPRSEIPPTPETPKRRPLTAPTQGRRAFTASQTSGRDRTFSGRESTRSAGHSKYKHLTLNIIGSRLPIGLTKEPGFKLPSLQAAQNTDRVPKGALDQLYKVNQPPPTPTSIVPSKDGRDKVEENRVAAETPDLNEPVAAVPVVFVEDKRIVEEEKMVEGKKEEVGENHEQNESEDLVSVPEVQAERAAAMDSADKAEEEAVEENVVQEEAADEVPADEIKDDENIEEVVGGNAAAAAEEEEEETVENAEEEAIDQAVEEQDNEVAEEVTVNEEVVDDGVGEQEEIAEDTEPAEESEEVVQDVVEDIKEEEKVINDNDNEGDGAKVDEAYVEEIAGDAEDVVEEEQVEEEVEAEQEHVEDEVAEQEGEEEQEVLDEPPIKEVRFFITEDGGGANTGAQGNTQQNDEQNKEKDVES